MTSGLDNASTHLPHIDGIRAVALLGVLLFHFEVPHFQGGFAGVDVFLPLSGFLITRNIAHKINSNNFSLFDFYQRRVFRLLPAAALVVFTSACMAAVLFPTDLAGSAIRSARAALLFHANAFFHSQSGYFDDAPQLKPLLHMWSLSLEEQFYFVWAPLLKLLSHMPRRARTMPAATLMLGIASLAMAVVVNESSPSFVFFELPPRIFQFAAGALLAFALPIAQGHAVNAAGPEPEKELDTSCKGARRASSRQLAAEAVAPVALVALVASYVLLPKGATALQMVPTTAATVALLATPSSRLARYVLSSRPLRHLGRVSYSAYLVHWPLFVFMRYIGHGFFKRAPPVAALFALTYILGVLLRAGVEDRVRLSKSVRTRWTFVVLFAAAVLASHWMTTSPIVRRLSAQPSSYTAIAPSDVRERAQLSVRPTNGLADTSVGLRRFILGDPSDPISKFVFFGNSYLGHLLVGLSRVAKRHGVKMEATYRPHCGFEPRDRPRDQECDPVRDAFWRLLDGMDGPRHVVLANHLGHESVEGLRNHTKWLYKHVTERGHNFSIIGNPPLPLRGTREYYMCADASFTMFARMLARLSGRAFNGARHCIKDLEEGFLTKENFWQDAEMVKLQKELPGMRFLDWKPYRCKETTKDGKPWFRCPYASYMGGMVYDNGVRRDGRHLSTVGSFYHADALDDFLFGGAPVAPTPVAPSLSRRR